MKKFERPQSFLTALYALCILVLGLHSPPSQADFIYVAPVQGVGVEATQLEALRELFKSHVDSSSHSTTDVVQGADFTLQSKLVKVSGFNLTMTKMRGPEKIKSTSWRAENFPSLETMSRKAVLKTIAHSPLETKNGQAQKAGELSSGSVAAGTALAELPESPQAKGKVSSSKKTNSSSPRAKQRSGSAKTQAPAQIRFGFGPSFFNNFNASTSGLTLLGGYYWNINNQIDLGVHGDFAISTEQTDVTLFTSRIMVNHFPVVLGDTSPYWGGGFGYGFASTHDEGPSEKVGGFAGSLQAGAKFFRTSSVNLGVGLEWVTVFKRTESYGIPSRFLFHVDVYF